MENYIGSATYSPDDNKIRISPYARLDKETYERVRAAGFIWAPKQEIFVAPMWTPGREDLAQELCGEIGDEDTTLEERAEARADRFENYSEKREKEANSTAAAVKELAGNIPFGQPILIGHHSEKRARRDAEKIENGMRRAVKLWETSEYWTRRAAGAIRHAKYKELPAVRARRIKKIEAEKRKFERARAQAAACLKAWTKEELTEEKALQLAGYSEAGRLIVTYKNEDGTANEMGWKAYDVLQPDGERYTRCPKKTLAEVQEAARQAYPRMMARHERWINHYENRLVYERAMLAEAGGLASDQKGPQKGGAVKCWVCSNRGEWLYIVKVNKISVSVLDNWGNGGRNFPRIVPFDKLKEVMTAAEVDEARKAGRLHENAYKTGFILADPKPEPKAEKEETPEQKPEEKEMPGDLFDQMKKTLKAGGVQTITAPQLFPTPRELAERMAKIADIQPGEHVLEPSAGTGSIIAAIGCKMYAYEPRRGELVAVEINPRLCSLLRQEFPIMTILPNDFLELKPEQIGFFDKILMNPPFENASDIKHIKHALTFLKDGGRLVAICANGPRQREKLMPLAENSGGFWEDLPRGTFSNAGTEVNTALLVIEK